MFPKLADLLSLAEKSSRRRYTFSPKDSTYTGCRYYINTLLPGTYIQPHRHNERGANELWFVLHGTVTPVIFSNDGKVISAYDISADEEIPFIEIPEQTYHTLLVQKTPSAILEISKGPYNPETYKEFAPWAPSETSEDSQTYLLDLERRVFHHIIKTK